MAAIGWSCSCCKGSCSACSGDCRCSFVRRISTEVLAGGTFVKTALLLFSVLGLSADAALAQSVSPQALPVAAEIAAPKDAPFRGTIGLQVDATDTIRHIFRVHETIPVSGAGPMMLLYPRWIPGNHAPTG